MAATYLYLVFLQNNYFLFPASRTSQNKEIAHQQNINNSKTMERLVNKP